jgi:hypothetical protein
MAIFSTHQQGKCEPSILVSFGYIFKILFAPYVAFDVISFLF